MSAPAELSIEPGMPVEIGRIDKELGKLWEASGDTKTRASLINLAIYSEDASSAEGNTALISEIAGEHACRAILILANPSAKESQAQAWISAHCHLVGKSERQICSEQITFLLNGEVATALPNIVFSHLDSDLPLCFWWQGEFREPLDEKLWFWVDRLILDSATWSKPGAQFQLVKKIAALADKRAVLCDLNWTRLLGTRFALAQFFDHSFALHHMRDIKRVSISCGNKTAGLLLLGWLSAQLEWKLQDLLDKSFFLAGGNRHVDFELREEGAEVITRCVFECDDATFEITRDAGSDYYHARTLAEGAPACPRILSAGKSKITDILLMELSRGGRHPLFLKSLAAVEPLFVD